MSEQDVMTRHSIAKPWKIKHPETLDICIYFINMHKQYFFKWKDTFWNCLKVHSLTFCLRLWTTSSLLSENCWHKHKHTRTNKTRNASKKVKLSFVTHILVKLVYTRNISMNNGLSYCWYAMYSRYCAINYYTIREGNLLPSLRNNSCLRDIFCNSR